MAERRWAIIVHGGAKTIESARAETNRAGCRDAVEVGAAILREGGSAIDAVQAAVRVLEDDPTFNAGRGSVPNAAGEIEMDASIMDGTTLDVGAVAAVRRLRNPIDAAVAMLREPPILLVGEGAERFAESKGIEVGNFDFAPPAGDASNHDTVGCVALDSKGRLAVGTSTGGLDGTLPGRVGDAPLPGCGFYADDAVGAVALSGDGEKIARACLASGILQEMKNGTVGSAVSTIYAPLRRLAGEAGAIAIDAAGRIGVAHNSAHFAMGLAASDVAGVHAALHRDELEGMIDE
jgi:beta-aspartyl-peptidase (threonine type)